VFYHANPQYPVSFYPVHQQMNPVPYAPVQPSPYSPGCAVSDLSDSMFALKLQEEENQAVRRPLYMPQQPSVDQTIARALVEAEQQQQRQKLERERADEEFARRLALEDQKQIAKAEEDRKRAAEAAKKAEETKKKLFQDEAFAKRLAEEEKHQLQLRLDYDLARKLEAQEKAAIPRPPPLPPVRVYNQHLPPHPHHRAHALQVHNSHCYCGNTQTWNNNHIYNVHKTHCSCNLNAPHLPSNSGRLHAHDHRCCNINHLHSENCYCVYRNHQHNYLCCNLVHSHNLHCNCTHK